MVNSSGDDRLHERKQDITAKRPERKADPDFGDEPPEESKGTERLGSLAQQARLKQLNQARGILIVVGIIMLTVDTFSLYDSKKGRLLGPRDIVERELLKTVPPGQVADPVLLKQAVDQATPIVTAFLVGAFLVDSLFIVLGFLVKLFPVPITILSLVLFILFVVVMAVLDPASIGKGIVLKIIVIVVLVKAIQAALAYEREGRELAEWKPEA